jgi:DNA invertase Pin-like site-specific DNA recombinase
MITDKIRPHHLQRKALLYVRQSSAHQVLHNRESSALQYAMRDRLIALGWSEIEVIDDDLGRSAAGGVQRAGFERMVAEVCLGKVGAVCAREVSRFARNSRDWQQLIEMCRVVDTVLVDQEAIYAPRHGNDRLLLGLKGSLNESVRPAWNSYAGPSNDLLILRFVSLQMARMWEKLVKSRA